MSQGNGDGGRLVVIGGSAGVVLVVEGELPEKRKRGRPPKYTPVQRAGMREMKRSGKTNREIAALFGCSPATVSRIVRE